MKIQFSIFKYNTSFYKNFTKTDIFLYEMCIIGTEFFKKRKPVDFHS